MPGTVGEEDEPLWKRIFLNEMLLVFVAAIIVLWVAFALATRHSDDEEKPKRAAPTKR